MPEKPDLRCRERISSERHQPRRGNSSESVKQDEKNIGSEKLKRNQPQRREIAHCEVHRIEQMRRENICLHASKKYLLRI